MPAETSTRRKTQFADAATVAFGTALTLCIYGYRFGEGNHTIYLLDALRRTDPQLLRNDWFTTQTLQYHAVFGWISAKLMRWLAIQPAFFAGYVLLIVFFHAAWLAIVRQLGGSRPVYFLSLLCYYASAAGTALGFYQFFQDSSFLPSNIANVAMLWGMALMIAGRWIGAGACLGIAGLFHLNHAVVVCGLWVGVVFLDRRWKLRALVGGTLLVFIPSLLNIGLALGAKMERTGSIPLGEFVDLYVRLRHPHHYDPQSWPLWLWVAFGWPIPFAIAWMRGRNDPPGRRLRQIFLLLLITQVIALLGAGVWYVSETLVQLSLYRFSIFITLLACIGTAAVIVRIGAPRLTGALAGVGCLLLMVASLLRGPFFGAFVMPQDDAEYRALCMWVGANTPSDAVFLVPPQESDFRLLARRAIVVNYKAVPQLGGELPEWRDRLCAVLDLQDLRALPRGYRDTLAAIGRRYATLSPDHLARVASRYDARFIVSTHPFDPGAKLKLIHSTATGRFFVYQRW